MTKEERISRDLAVLIDWYHGRPHNLNHRELGERYGLSESGAYQLIHNVGGRGGVAHMLFPALAQSLSQIRIRWEPFSSSNRKRGMLENIAALLKERTEWTRDILQCAEDRRDLYRRKGF